MDVGDLVAGKWLEIDMGFKPIVVSNAGKPNEFRIYHKDEGGLGYLVIVSLFPVLTKPDCYQILDKHLYDIRKLGI